MKRGCGFLHNSIENKHEIDSGEKKYIFMFVFVVRFVGFVFVVRLVGFVFVVRLVGFVFVVRLVGFVFVVRLV